ncbi:hypothetical protein ABQW67_19825 [Xanthomonas hortorum]|uniref:hypothetical protein n=1 Tax=Xanthomonas hortorum TaxID=56454 RepID=UPI001E5CCFB6|nr:hypothetical protein [Xanthomonas hortorum]MCC8492399.1 hypothetical protein [Xanthomonas hortorum pv. gardneri]MCE4343972.1 hypothetical protein [Xanthomonas hortorum pv. vitians]MCE4530985.1 hypothetical protein [Xanthomonas hortorum pv. vitians]
MNEHSGNAGQLPPDAGSGGDVLLSLISQWRANADENELHALEADSIGIPQATCTHDLRMKLLRQHADQLEAALAARQPVGVEPVDFDYPEFREEGMGCGLEDRNITDRYEAMRYGFEEALDQMATILDSIGPLYTAPPAPAAVPADGECGNCHDGKSDMDHDCRECGGTGQLPPAPAVPVDALRDLLARRIAQWRSHIPANPDAPGTRAIETTGETDYNNDVAIWRQGITVMDEALALLATHPQPAAASWRPIGEAVAGKLYVVGWRDPRDTETPDRHEFDYMADGEFWANHDDAVQHAEAVAPAGSEMPPQDAPYQWLIEIPALPSAERHAKPAGEASSSNQPETTR